MLISKLIRELIFVSFIGLITGCIIGSADLYHGLLNTEISIRTYLMFLMAYILGCIILSIVINIVISVFLKSVNNRACYYIIYFVCLLLLSDFVYVNAKLNGWFKFFNLRAIVVNIILFSGIIFLTWLIFKINKVRNHFSNIWGFLTMTIMTFHFIAILNHFLLNWSSPPENKITILVMLFFILVVPFVTIMMKNIFDRIFTSFNMLIKISELSLAVLFVLCVPLILRYPVLSYYENTKYKHDERQLEFLKDKPNIILIVLDTARRDNLSCYGHYRNTTPNIDEFSENGVLFNKYISTAPYTLPSHASMFTGMYSSKHSAHFIDGAQRKNPLAYENVTLAETLKDNGFNTGAIVANPTLTRRIQLDQGFNFYYCQSSSNRNFFWGLVFEHTNFFRQIQRKPFFRLNMYKLSSEINTIVLRWVKRNKTNPFFLFINYMEPHEGAYYLPESYDSLYGFYWSKWNKYAPKQEDITEIILEKKSITPEQLQIQYDWVDCKISYLDNQIGKLLNRLKAMDLYNNSMIIIVSDHGDLFGEHNSFGHIEDLYNELIKVPLIIKYPRKMNLKGIVDKPVQNVDLMPEILKILDIPLPEGIQGQPITEVNHKIVAELFRCKDCLPTKVNPERFYRNLKTIFSNDGYKYIQASKGKSELYYLINDPYERRNIISQMSLKADELDKKLVEWSQSFKPVKTAEKKQKKIDRELEERLRALGYIK